MGDEIIGPEKEEATKFNLEQADKKFAEALKSATNEEQVRQAIEDLHDTYSDEVVESAGDRIEAYIPMYISALQNLKLLPDNLKQTIDMTDYDLANTILEGLSDDYITEHEVLDEKGEPIDKLAQWGKDIDQLFEELGVVE